MKELIVKLETLKESKEWTSQVQKLRDGQAEKDKKLLEWPNPDEEVRLYSEADMLRHEIGYIGNLMWGIKVKDKETREALVEDLEKSKNWRVNRLLGKTHEYKLENILEWDAYTEEDLYRAENRWIECFENLPTKLAEELKVKEQQEEATREAEVQEQIDAMASLELNGL